MALRYAIHTADGVFLRGGTDDTHELDEGAASSDGRHGLYRRIAPSLEDGQRLTVGWDECVFCGAPLTDSIEYLSAARYCSQACAVADEPEET